jgi:hypothetical protein
MPLSSSHAHSCAAQSTITVNPRAFFAPAESGSARVTTVGERKEDLAADAQPRCYRDGSLTFPDLCPEHHQLEPQMQGKPQIKCLGGV